MATVAQPLPAINGGPRSRKTQNNGGAGGVGGAGTVPRNVPRQTGLSKASVLGRGHVPANREPIDAVPSSNHNNHSNNENHDDKYGVPKTQAICLDLLVAGHVRSYIDFFNMAIGKNQVSSAVPTSRLDELKNLLTKAEDSHRGGETRAIYEAKKNLAAFFDDLGSHDIAVGYYKEAFQAAKMMHTNKDAEIEAALNLGHVLEKSGKITEALEYYEQSRSHAKDKSDTRAESEAAKSVVSVRIKIAERVLAKGHYTEAIGHFKHCADIIQESNLNENLLNDIYFRLGTAHKSNGDVPTAISYLEQYLKKCQDSGDMISAGKAQTALASCYESFSNPTQATDYLQQFVSITENDPTQQTSLAQACKQLGIIYNKMGKYDEAVTYFERQYEIACSLSNDLSPSTSESAISSGKEPTTLVQQQTQQQQQRPLSPVVVAGSGGPGPTTTTSTISPSEQIKAKRQYEAMRTIGVSAVQLGLSKANANMTKFFEYVVAAQTKNSEAMASLIRWKANRSFESREEDMVIVQTVVDNEVSGDAGLETDGAGGLSITGDIEGGVGVGAVVPEASSRLSTAPGGARTRETSRPVSGNSRAEQSTD
ncbi:Tetratricopeptide repeat protein 29 [Blyttiomyces sp. JEL0837]|nr:Tetratricopeptide repeat protein 29 [Blyttiomyces sp. JEL0837]